MGTPEESSEEVTLLAPTSRRAGRAVPAALTISMSGAVAGVVGVRPVTDVAGEKAMLAGGAVIWPLSPTSPTPRRGSKAVASLPLTSQLSRRAEEPPGLTLAESVRAVAMVTGVSL